MPSVDDQSARRALFRTTDQLQITVAGRGFTTWENVTVERSIEQAAGVFSINATSPEQISAGARTPRFGRAARSVLFDERIGVLFQLPFGPQDPVTVKVADELVITGRVDALEAAFDKGSGTVLRLGGRDAAQDLVDCSALNKPGQWFDVTIEQLAKDICAPFNVPVRVSRSTGDRLASFKLQESESAMTALERACRMRALLCFSDGEGGLVIEAPGAGGSDGPGRIAEGENVESARLSLNEADRFSVYYVRGQRPGSAASYGDAAALIESNALDAGVRRYRPLVILAEGAVTDEEAGQRAQWEAIVRATRAHRLIVTVPGWRRPLSEQVWRLNTLIPVAIPTLGISAELLVAGVTFTRDRNDGTKTQLLLARPDAYIPQPELEGKSAKNKSKRYTGEDPLAPPVDEEDEDFDFR